VEPIQRDTTECLQRQEVESLLGGKLTAQDESRVLAHLADCRGCRDAVKRAGGNDSAIVSRQQATTETNLGGTPPSKPSRLSATAETQIDPVADAPKPVSLMFAFLAPAELPDELGRLGGYRILRVIGEGGMGVVFEAEDPHLHRRVAIKVLKPHGPEDPTRDRFLQEARLAASLSDARIVTIHQVGEDRGWPFIVMELLHGESLDTLLKRRHTLPASEALRIAREVAEGLALAHDHGLIHRDIKPANIWLEKPRSAAEPPPVKLLDFGIARSMESDTRLTIEGRIVGTPSYLCPEQACSEPLDGRCDLFSLGCVLYAMLAGASPFERKNTILSIRAVLDDEPPTLPAQLPGPLVALVGRLLSKEPRDRPATARQVADEIRRLEAAFPGAQVSQATLPIPLHGVNRAARRHLKPTAWAAIAAIAAIAAMVLAMAVGLWPQAPSGVRTESANAARPAGATLPVELPAIKVGIVHSLSGPMATSERPVVDAWLFAIDEINAAGGLLGGRKIEALVRDGKSYDDVFAEQAKALIVDERVATLFGCWRSSCRKSVEEVCRKYGHLLVYPTAYEGLEESPNVIYMGGAPNQQILPSVKWAFAFLEKRKFFLVGTDGVYSRCAHEIIQDEVATLGGKIVGNRYRVLADNDFAPVASEIQKSGADVIVNTVVGTGNIALFSALRKAGIRPDKIPVISMNVTEEELRTLSARSPDIAGDYAAWSYFQSLPGRVNQEFLARFHKRFGPTRVVNDPMVAAYVGMHLWALAVDESRSDRVADIRAAFVRQQLESPEGLVKINPQNQHAWRMALIGQVNEDYHFEVVWTSPRPLDPQPFPPYRSRPQWEAFLAELHKQWGGHWRPEPSATPPGP
jgi:urea transport system substrate-binding protein